MGFLRYKKSGGLTAESKRALQDVLSGRMYGRTAGGRPKVLPTRNIELYDRDTGRRSLAAPVYRIPLGNTDRRAARELIEREHPRKQNLLHPRPTIMRPTMEYCEERFDYSGSFTRWYGSRGFVRVQSFCAITPEMLSGKVRGEEINIKAPRGYEWRTIDAGPALVRLSDETDYHPDADDLRKGARYIQHRIVAKAKWQASLRREMREQDRERAQLERKLRRIVRDNRDLMVRFSDSLSAHNCRFGTEQYCLRNHLDPKKCYRAGSLPERDTREVAAAILASRRRYLEDLKRGYCQVEFDGD